VNNDLLCRFFTKSNTILIASFFLLVFSHSAFAYSEFNWDNSNLPDIGTGYNCIAIWENLSVPPPPAVTGHNYSFIGTGYINNSGGIDCDGVNVLTYGLHFAGLSDGNYVLEWGANSIFPFTVDYWSHFTISGGAFLPPATCSDGIQNQNETAIDFGGICPEIQTVSSDITTSTTWDRGHLYFISGNIEITTGDTLTIEPGTIIKFDTSTASSLTVNGTLIAVGNAGDDHSLGEIFFTSSKDDSLLGLDTNSDGNSTSPTAGDWGGIVIGSGGSATFNLAVVRYAGATGTAEAEVYNDGGTLTVENSDFVHGTTYGIKNLSGTTDISNKSDIGFNDYGIYNAGGTVSITGSVIHDNSLYGIYNNTVSNIVAENNYWGDPTGPYHNSSNLSGLGNAVSNYVDFDPWTDYKHYISHELIPDNYCANFNECTSVYNNELRWKNVNVTSYSSQLSSALSTWDALGSVDIIEDNSTPSLEVHESSVDDVNWKGRWIPEVSPDSLILNSYYLTGNTSSQIQNTITHEIGHALGLYHSYTGNIMYFNQTSQTSLGPQDESDYYYLWP
jgi:hypothetical protein